MPRFKNRNTRYSIRGRQAKYAPKRRSRVGRRRTREHTAPKMTKRKILNITSRKKRNTMLSVTNSTMAGVGQATFTTTPLVVNAGTQGWVVWAATAQHYQPDANVTQVSARTSARCFMRGLKEKIKIQTSSALPWFWRRIVFRAKNAVPFTEYITSPTNLGIGPWYDGSSGIQRLLLNSNSQTVNQAPTVSRQQSVLFKGTSGVDWNDPIYAAVDTTRVTLMFDKTWTIKSGNNNGTIKEVNLWHTMNKYLVYDDDENGFTETSQYLSTDASPGMGDVFVIDQFQCGTGGTASDLLQFGTNASLYWHKK
ncbi:capsid protein [robinz virus RP_380]|nr:capsid protein [robinz virus RP_380]